MPSLTVNSLTFSFETNFVAKKYDEMSYYSATLSVKNKKAVDVVAMRNQQAPVDVWLIEAKDYRIITSPPKPANLSHLGTTVATKVKDSLAGLLEIEKMSSCEIEIAHARRAIQASQTRIVLHLEPHVGLHTKLFPTNFSSGVLQKLKQLVRDIDSNPMVLSISTTPRAGVPWTVV